MLDYLIIGQGIAGSVLSYTLLQSGHRLKVLDSGSPYSASQAASGLCNPITGRRLVKTWRADELFPFLHSFYVELAQEIKEDFWREIEVYRPFNSEKQKQQWQSKLGDPSWEQFIQKEEDGQKYAHFVDSPLGGWTTQQALFINSPQLLKAYRLYLQNQGLLIQEAFQHAELEIKVDSVQWKGYQARKIIFCEGYRVMRNPWFAHLPFKPDKGEWIKVKIPGGQIPNALKKNVFMIPLGKEEFLVSGTYHAQEGSPLPSLSARDELEDRLKKIFKGAYQVIQQKAGIRGATRHRRPLIGVHPEHPPLVLFNGFGTKGLSLSPLLAKELEEHLEKGQALNPEIDIQKGDYWS